MQFTASLLFSLIFTASQLYYITTVGLTPLQLVLTGTILEATVFLFEIPTGVVADVRSRRLSVVTGYAIMGLGFLMEGAFPFFAAIAVAQVVWGFGYTFTSGATQAWIADELGEERAGDAFLRGSQAGRVGALLAIPISVALGTLALRVPILLGGVSMILLALFLLGAMTEEGFTPTPSADRTTWTLVRKTVKDARHLVRRQPVLLVLLAISLFYGLYSEGFDRLWTVHFLESFQAPWAQSVEPIVWFGAIRAVSLLIGIGATELARRGIDTRRSLPIARALLVTSGLIILALAGFGLARSFWFALLLFWLIGALRSLGGPLQTAWYNRSIDDSQVRATMFSITGQVDAIGQIAAGPAVGAIGNASVRAALVLSALILSPVLPLYAYAIRRLRPFDTKGDSGRTVP